MILSVSRRTDIPRYYMNWFLSRLEDGYVLVRNPMNHSQVSRVELNSDTIDCIGFWTKDPSPMLNHLDELKTYNYFIQFTLNPYGNEIETELPPLSDRIETFKSLAQKIGKEKMIWRYSPIILSENYTLNWHIKKFESIASSLSESTEICRISFLDIYKKIEEKMHKMKLRDSTDEEKRILTKAFVKIGADYGISIGGCGNLDLDDVGLEKAGCIDASYVSKIIGSNIKKTKDTGQRSDCYCMPSIDIGTYNTCLNGCQYCYANFSKKSIQEKFKLFDPSSPLLCDEIRPTDKITERKLISYADPQLSMF